MIFMACLLELMFCESRILQIFVHFAVLVRARYARARATCNGMDLAV